MLILSTAEAGRKIVSIHSGGVVALIEASIIDPSRLKIVAFSVRGPRIKYFSILHTSDIREWGRGMLGVVINSEDDIVEVAEDMPKIKTLVEEKFRLVGINVRTESGKRLGRVKSYVFDSQSFDVTSINVEKLGIFSIFSGRLAIGRVSILNVTKRYIVVKDGTEKIGAALKPGLIKNAADNVEYGFNSEGASLKQDNKN